MLHPDARLGVVQYDPNHVVTQLEFPLFVVPTTANPNVSAPARPIAVPTARSAAAIAGSARILTTLRYAQAVLYLPLDHGCELRTPKLAPHLALLPFGDPSVPCGPAIQAETAQLNGAIAVLFYLPPITSRSSPTAATSHHA
ncbi:hypothetical protein GGF32_002745 [Allomyces javanicus]|nr:hypothetical protein GGF32_002745 [Allomyces javanicus]